MGNYKTEQENFWAGEFGDSYVDRNKSSQLAASNIAFFSRILSYTEKIESVIEFGANIGLNLRAVRQLLPEVALAAVEINNKAVDELNKWSEVEVHAKSILEFQPQKQWSLVLIKGVLIHLNPEVLSQVYDLLYQSSDRYICIAEYYNPSPVEVNYRGHQGKLFKRDFAGEILDRYGDLRLKEYGFSYHRDYNFPQDDITWFLLEKKKR